MEHRYMNMHGYSDVHPYEVVRVVSARCVEVREMSARLAEGQRPEIIPGGFAGHCVNQRSLVYEIQPNPNGQVIRVRQRQNGQWHSAMGRHVPAAAPRYFYDYNF